MRMALRCEKCRQIYMDEGDALQIQIDFYDKTISYICMNKECRHENTLDFKSWQKQQKNSPLPQMRIV